MSAKTLIILDGQSLLADAGERLLDLCDESPVQVLATQCRGGHCGRCLVRVVEGERGLLPARADERQTLAELSAPADARLGCQVFVAQSDLCVVLQTSGQARSAAREE